MKYIQTLKFSLFSLIIVGLSACSSGSSLPGITAPSAEDQVKGNYLSTISLIEYGDFQCPACGYYAPMVQQISEEFGTKINVVSRNFPLNQIHKNAQITAQAAEAAGEQGKFWEMHDKLFETQKDWSESVNMQEVLVTYATELGLNIEQFNTDLQSAEIKTKIKNDYKSGVAAGVTGTPSYFLNGKKLDNPRSIEDFRAAVEAVLK